jgi:hypothetical protein
MRTEWEHIHQVSSAPGGLPYPGRVLASTSQRALRGLGRKDLGEGCTCQHYAPKMLSKTKPDASGDRGSLIWTPETTGFIFALYSAKAPD